MDEDKQKALREEVEKVAKSNAKARGATARFSVESSCPSLLNNAEFRDFCTKSVAELYDAENVHMSCERGGGSEDFAFISRRVPSVMLAIAAGGSAEGCTFSAHNPKNCYSEDVIKYGAAIYAKIAVAYR